MKRLQFRRGFSIFSGLLVAFTFSLASCSQEETYEPKPTAVKTQSKSGSAQADDFKVVVNEDSLESLKPPFNWHP